MIKQLYRFLHPKFQNIFLDYRVDMQPRYGHGKPPHPQLQAIIDSHREDYKKLLAALPPLKEHFWSITTADRETDPTRPAYNNGYLPGLDIVILYAMLVGRRPARYVEIGSGNSTKVAYKAKREHDLPTEIVSIDPQPRAEIDELADRVVRQPFESTDLDLVEELRPNDILFVDNSHRILPNSDAMVFFLEVLPRLRPGVIVHVHDVHLPYDYPQFMCDRAYSEQYGLAMYLLADPGRYRPLLPNFFISEDAELAGSIEEIWAHENLRGVERHGVSFWLEIQ